MKRLGLALVFALLCLPRGVPAQTTTPAVPTSAMREQAIELMHGCETSNDEEPYSFEPSFCYVVHVNAGSDAIKRRIWNQAIDESTYGIDLLVTYRQRIFETDPDRITVKGTNLVAAYLNRSLAYGEIKQYSLAISDATAAITFNPSSPDAWNARCWLRAITGDLANALRDCDKALELAPKNAAIWDSTGFVYLKMKNYPAAVTNYQAALKISPKAASSLYGLGLAEQAEGNQTQGNRDIAAAAEINPKISAEFGT